MESFIIEIDEAQRRELLDALPADSELALLLAELPDSEPGVIQALCR